MFRITTFAIHLAAVLAVGNLCNSSAYAETIVLDDFEDGVTYQGGSPSPMPDNTWLEVKDAWNTVASAAQFVDGSPALKVEDFGNSDRTSYRNGLYANFVNKVPVSGYYIVRCTAKFKDRLNGGTYNTIQSYIIGVTVNGTHRNATEALPSPGIWNVADQPLAYFDDLDEWQKDPLELKSPVFTATPTDTIQIILTCDGRYKYYSGNWISGPDGAYALIDNVELVRVDENGVPIVDTPVTLSTWTLE